MFNKFYDIPSTNMPISRLGKFHLLAVEADVFEGVAIFAFPDHLHNVLH